MKKTHGFNLFLTLVAAAVAAADLGGVENEMTTTAATTVATSPHVHIRGASGGIFDEKREEEVTSACGPSTYQTDPNIGKRCEIGSDCKSQNPRCWRLICVKSDPFALFGRCAREPLCHEEGDYCDKDYECCGSFECKDSICTRDTNDRYCQPKGGSCNADYKCCGDRACGRSRCSGTAYCKKPGGYCEVDDECCDSLECGVSNHCVIVNSPCRALGQSCDDGGYAREQCCDGLKCKNSKCVKAGLSKCKARGDDCDDFNQCCGDLECYSTGSASACLDTTTPVNPCKYEGEYCDDYAWKCCEGLGLTCGVSNRCVKKSCGTIGVSCMSIQDCCDDLRCIKNSCSRGTSTIDGCRQYGEQCLRTSDCCVNMNCKSNQCR